MIKKVFLIKLKKVRKCLGRRGEIRTEELGGVRATIGVNMIKVI